MSKKRGLLVSFEGIEGTGKSTQCRLLCEYLKRKKLKVAVFYEPGSSALGERVRRILLHGRRNISGFSEVMLFIAAREQLRKEKIEPSLKVKDIVILDRYGDSTVAYQGYGSGVDIKLIEKLNALAMGGAVADKTILLDINPNIGLLRSGRNDRFEKRKIAFHDKVRKGYLKLAKRYPRRIKLIDATSDIKLVQKQIREIIDCELKNRRKI